MLDPSILYMYRATHLVTDKCKKDTLSESQWPYGSPRRWYYLWWQWRVGYQKRVWNVLCRSSQFPYFNLLCFPLLFTQPFLVFLDPDHTYHFADPFALLFSAQSPKMFPTYFVSISPSPLIHTRPEWTTHHRQESENGRKEISKHQDWRCRQIVRCWGTYYNRPSLYSPAAQRYPKESWQAFVFCKANRRVPFEPSCWHFWISLE